MRGQESTKCDSAKKKKSCDSLIIGASDARVVVLSNTLKTTWAARGAHSDDSLPLVIVVCEVMISVVCY